jgi:serine/threonine-protein kinase SRPK3
MSFSNNIKTYKTYSSGSSPDSSNMSYYSDEEESYKDFKGEYLNNEYIIIKKIGSGMFSTVWLTFSTTQNKYFAIKIQNDEDYDEGILEVSVLQNIKNENSKYINNLIEHFIINNGDKEYICMVFNLLSCDIYSIIKQGKYKNGLPIKTVKDITIQMLIALSQLHTQNKIIHCDIKPENLLLKGKNNKIENIINQFNSMNFSKTIKKYKKRRTKYNIKSIINKFLDKLDYSSSDSDTDRYNSDSDEENYDTKNKKYNDNYCCIDDKYIDNINIQLSDFGSSIKLSNINNKEIQTRYYRAPEVIIKYKYNEKIDIWSLGCLIFELLTGEILFDPKKTRELNRDRIHIKYIYEKIGKLPSQMINSCERNKVFFKRNGLLKGINNLKANSLQSILIKKFKNILSTHEIYLMSTFLYKLLTINPENRPSASECLLDPWIRDQMNEYI